MRCAKAKKQQNPNSQCVDPHKIFVNQISQWNGEYTKKKKWRKIQWSIILKYNYGGKNVHHSKILQMKVFLIKKSYIFYI